MSLLVTAMDDNDDDGDSGNGDVFIPMPVCEKDLRLGDERRYIKGKDTHLLSLWRQVPTDRPITGSR